MKKFVVILCFIFSSTILKAGMPIGDSVNYVKSWAINNVGFIDSTDIDTVLYKAHLISPYFLHGNRYMTTGNNGHPILAYDYTLRHNSTREFYFALPFAPYLPDEKTKLVYKSKVPYSRLSYFYSMGSKQKLEQVMNFYLTQNANPHLNLGFLFDYIDSEGQYYQQSSKVRTFGLFASYMNYRYSAFAGANVNTIRQSENGGIDSVTFNAPGNLYNTFSLLTGANSKTRTRTAYFYQNLHIGKRWIDSMMVDSTENEDGDIVYDTNFSYKIKERFRLSHMMDYQDNNRYYLDPSLNDDFYNLWYDTSHIVKGAEQFDSSYFRMLKNDLLLNYTNYKSPQLLSTVYAGISILNEGHYFLNHHPLTVNDTGFLNTTASTFMRLGLKNMGNKKFLYSFDYSGGFLGNRVGEHLMTTTLLRSISSKNHLYIKLEGSDYLRKPDYFVRNYSSFIRSWSKDLKDQQTRTVNLAITNLKNLNFYYGFVFEKDLVFFEDTTIGPVQSPGEKRVVQIGVNYDFQLWRFVFNNKVLNQNASAKGMTRVPEWMFSHTIYYDKAFTIKSTGGKFHIQIGIDAFYFTKFEAMTYNPITAQFFNVHGHYLGNYPYVDAFVNFKLKRARLFLMAEHLSYGWFGNNYYTLYNFPMNPRTIKFGFSWNFYN